MMLAFINSYLCLCDASIQLINASYTYSLWIHPLHTVCAQKAKGFQIVKITGQTNFS